MAAPGTESRKYGFGSPGIQTKADGTFQFRIRRVGKDVYVNWFRRMMQGRNGGDQLGNFLIYTSLALFVVELFVPTGPAALILSVAVWALILWALFRMFSKNVSARRRENLKFCTAAGRLRSWFASLPQYFKERRAYKYFSCPNCSQKVRIPRGAGKVKITCPRCGEKFEGKA